MKELISKYSPAVIITLLGISTLIFGASTSQNSIFMIAGVAVIIAGIATLLNSMGFISNKISMIVAVVLFGLSGYLAYSNYHSIDEPIQFMKEKHVRYSEIIQSLKDLREVELTYKKENKVFCGSMDTLMNFLMNDSVTLVVMNGDVPDSLTAAEALELGIITRDTTLYPAYDITFNETYLGTRDAKYPLDVNTLRYVPFTENVEFKIDAGQIVRSSGAKVQVFEISDAAPFDKDDIMKVGSMVDPTTSGNWKEEK